MQKLIFVWRKTDLLVLLQQHMAKNIQLNTAIVNTHEKLIYTHKQQQSKLNSAKNTKKHKKTGEKWSHHPKLQNPMAKNNYR